MRGSVQALVGVLLVSQVFACSGSKAPDKSPTASIASPHNGFTELAGHPVEFEGSGDDPENGMLPGTALTWRSSIDGSLGTGTSLTNSDLSVGSHSITLIAVDPSGSSDSTRIWIDILPLPGDAFESDDNSEQATQTGSGDIQTHNISPATDEDWITFTLTEPSVVVLETRGEPGDDTVLELYDGRLGLIESDDDSGLGSSSRITRICGESELQAGTWLARVTSSESKGVIGDYDLAYTAVSCAEFETASPGYGIDVRYLGTPPTPAQQLTFENAAARWEEIIVGDIPDEAVLEPFAPSCLEVGLDPLVEQIDDLVIFVRVGRQNRASGTLGSAGPCLFRAGTRHPLVGLMSFDPAVVTEAAVLHEMAHVIGFGILWDDLGLLQNPTDPPPAPIDDTHFRGTNAIEAFNAIGGAAYPDAKVPVENENTKYGPGTLNEHWRESVLDAELMTSALDTGVTPISIVTVEAFRDMGYEVDPAAADPFMLSPSRAANRQGTKLRFREFVRRGLRLFTEGDGGLRPSEQSPVPVEKGDQ